MGKKFKIGAAEKAGKTVMIGFNLRHNPVLKKVKELLDAGVVGRIFLIENREFYEGGRSYMSRWNRSYAKSGGLWVHKGSHDFDVFQWLMGFPKPVKVSAFAGINVFTPNHLPFELKPGISPGPVCHHCAYRKDCPDCYDSGDIRSTQWSDEAAAEDGYHKDVCMYLSEKDVHDNGIAMVEYDNGARASHLECFATPVHDRLYTIVGSAAQIEVSLTNRHIVIRPRWGREVITYELPENTGGHGGADPYALDSFFETLSGSAREFATAEQGMWATAVGEAAEIARRENRIVMMEELIR